MCFLVTGGNGSSVMPSVDEENTGSGPDSWDVMAVSELSWSKSESKVTGL